MMQNLEKSETDTKWHQLYMKTSFLIRLKLCHTTRYGFRKKRASSLSMPPSPAESKTSLEACPFSLSTLGTIWYQDSYHP